jgi:hypothetical protein
LKNKKIIKYPFKNYVRKMNDSFYIGLIRWKKYRMLIFINQKIFIIQLWKFFKQWKKITNLNNYYIYSFG